MKCIIHKKTKVVERLSDEDAFLRISAPKSQFKYCAKELWKKQRKENAK